MIKKRMYKFFIFVFGTILVFFGIINCNPIDFTGEDNPYPPEKTSSYISTTTTTTTTTYKSSDPTSSWTIATLYGVEPVTWEFAGTVVRSSDGNPIYNIKVDFNGDQVDYTDLDGTWQISATFWQYDSTPMVVTATDIDGYINGGKFEQSVFYIDGTRCFTNPYYITITMDEIYGKK